MFDRTLRAVVRGVRTAGRSVDRRVRSGLDAVRPPFRGSTTILVHHWPEFGTTLPLDVLAAELASSSPRRLRIVHVDPVDGTGSYGACRRGTWSVRYRSERFFAVLASAAVILTNGPLPRTYARHEGQRIVSTWDGRSTWARDQADRDAATAHADLVRAVYLSDVLVSSGDRCTARYGSGELRLGEIYDGVVVEPRTDVPESLRLMDQCRRVVAALTRTGDDAEERRREHDEKQRLLVYLGPMESNGITTSGLSLLEELDHDAFDVTVVVPGDCPVERLAQIDSRARVLAWIGPMGLDQEQSEVRRLFQRHGLEHQDVDSPRTIQLFEREWARVFGTLRFDLVLNFEGYSPFWAMLLSSGPSRCAIWLHNEMWTDAHKLVNGEQPNLERLLSVFSTYHRYDDLVSVSEALHAVNVTDLARYGPSEAFTWIPNTLGSPARPVQAVVELPVATRQSARTLEPPEGEARPTTLGDVLADVLDVHGEQAVEREVGRIAALRRWVPSGASPTFVTVGRLSPEKGHDLLLEAFAEVLEKLPEAVLLVLGDGPRRSHLEARSAELDIGRSVIFTGYTDHVADVLAAADCFVLASSHEGAPMVILEARALGVPVVATRFRTVHGVLPAGDEWIVARNAAELGGAMVQAVADGERERLVRAQHLDVDDWNRAAMTRFGEVFSR